MPRQLPWLQPGYVSPVPAVESDDEVDNASEIEEIEEIDDYNDFVERSPVFLRREDFGPSGPDIRPLFKGFRRQGDLPTVNGIPFVDLTGETADRAVQPGDGLGARTLAPAGKFNPFHIPFTY
jgi:hypothetical protein